jgi:UDPglucose 6-dehydrogenase
MRICIVGTGYVGLVTGACLADFGHVVVCVDKDASKIALLRQGVTPIYEPGLEDLLKANIASRRLTFDTALRPHIAGSEAVFIAVGTPPGDDAGRANLSFVHEYYSRRAAGRSILCRQ